MITLTDTRYDTEYEYFSTGIVVEYNRGDVTCTVDRTEGGTLKNVPILGMFGAGGTKGNLNYMGDLVDCYVALIKIQGIYCVLGTLPNFGWVSRPQVKDPSGLPSEGK